MSNNTRYEAVAPMPHFTHLFKGDILYPKQHALCDLCWGAEDEDNPHRWVTFCPDYPHLFRPLKWWEGLAVDELPKYVKVRDSDIVLSIIKWNIFDNGQRVFGNVFNSIEYNTVYTWWCVPATESEYNEYITKLNGE